ncbi:MAG: hypothetical protein P8Q36_00990 [Alphaproteobacteria bacterium]|jgi:hypothetical protein|nr:hypothetical protein [Rhodospirillaceae bacterium]MBT6204784.1 hypothetical protein [Rhodospirillaceae bacterium]MBT7613324.1 hypothetical protein [Rhodospirillaceae bacterium]MBT7647610.1 hypothetical protein [Rhodospirillaceae bacterium]MDG2479431.1 hypothetical protein [Alphaproteobacteria bacterium]
MNHRHCKVLHALYAHPVSTNISMKDIEVVISELGGEVDAKHHQGARVGFKLNGHSAVFHEAGHAVPKEEVQKIRKFLEDCGVDPERDYPL